MGNKSSEKYNNTLETPWPGQLVDKSNANETIIDYGNKNI